MIRPDTITEACTAVRIAAYDTAIKAALEAVTILAPKVDLDRALKVAFEATMQTIRCDEEYYGGLDAEGPYGSPDEKTKTDAVVFWAGAKERRQMDAQRLAAERKPRLGSPLVDDDDSSAE